MSKHNLFILLRILIVIATTIGGIILIYYLGTLMVPFIIGFFLALIINPLVKFIQERTKMSRGFAVFTSIIIIIGVISAAITLLVTEIIQGFSHLSKIIPEHYEKLSQYIQDMYEEKVMPLFNDLLSMFRGLEQGQQGTLLDGMQFVGERLTYTISTIIQNVGNGLYIVISKLPNFAFIFIISLLATFFISKDWDRIVSRVNERIPEKIHRRINQIYEGLQRALLGFLKAEIQLTFITACIVFVGLLILRVEHALSIALIVWIVDFAPYIGAILVFLPWALYSFFTGDIFLGTGLSILYGLIVLQRQLIKPKILSSSIGISPLVTLFTMYVGFQLIGILGLILGPLTFIMLKILNETGILREIWDFIVGKRKAETE